MSHDDQWEGAPSEKEPKDNFITLSTYRAVLPMIAI